jgi:hypothetical protein
MAKLLLLWLLVTCTGLAGMTNVVTGAFGVKLGEPLTLKPGEITSRQDMTYVRAFIPDAPMAAFEKYEATLLKDGDIVMMIAAHSGKLPKNDSKAKFDGEVARLSKSYGEPQVTISDAGIEIVAWTNATHSVTAYREIKQDDSTFGVSYLDERQSERIRTGGSPAGTGAIVGAFGVNLGEPFEESPTTKKIPGRNEISYLFTPPNAFAPLTTYAASTPAHTNLVFQISAYSKLLGWAEGKEAHQKLESGLRSKYGEPKESAKEDGVLYVIWEKGARNIHAFLLKSDSAPGQFNLGVSYTDAELEKMSKPAKPKVDTSGL